MDVDLELRIGEYRRDRKLGREPSPAGCQGLEPGQVDPAQARPGGQRERQSARPARSEKGAAREAALLLARFGGVPSPPPA
jgi:hypothetical protein